MPLTLEPAEFGGGDVISNYTDASYAGGICGFKEQAQFLGRELLPPYNCG